MKEKIIYTNENEKEDIIQIKKLEGKVLIEDDILENERFLVFEDKIKTISLSKVILLLINKNIIKENEL